MGGEGGGVWGEVWWVLRVLYYHAVDDSLHIQVEFYPRMLLYLSSLGLA